MDSYGRPPTSSRVLPLLLSMVVGLAIGFWLFRWVDSIGTPAVEARPVAARGDLAADEKTTIAIFRQTSPSVVYITTLAQRLDLWTMSATEVPQGTGTGIIWDDAGDIVTNYHVINNATGAQVALADHSTYPAELVGASPRNDLAVLRIHAPKDKLRAILVGASHDLEVGQRVYAIGDPFGLDQTLTTGVVSALGRHITRSDGPPIEDVIQTDAAINHGNSGGPLLDSSGRLIGVNAAIYSPSGASAGIGFAIPVDTVNRIVPQLIAHGHVARPQISGLVLSDRLSYLITRRMGVHGVLVVGVEPGSLAAQGGLRGTQRTAEGIIPGDVIQKVNGKSVSTSGQFYDALEGLKPGQTVALTAYRDGTTTSLNVKLSGTAE